MSIRVFVDSDVVVSSLIPPSGAAHLLLFSSTNIDPLISNISQEELLRVAKRLKIDRAKLKQLIEGKFRVVNLQRSIEQLKKKFQDYVVDPNDAHIVAGASHAKVRFLISYNIRHLKGEKIKQDFNIVVTTPAHLLQYLRSL